MGPKRILVAEEDAARGARMRALLEEAGYLAHWVKDGHGVLSMYRSFQPDLILLDVRLSGDNGCRVSRLVKSLASEFKSPAILLTVRRRPGAGEASESDLLQASRADGILHRPLTSRQLTDRIEAMLAETSSPAA